MIPMYENVIMKLVPLKKKQYVKKQSRLGRKCKRANKRAALCSIQGSRG